MSMLAEPRRRKLYHLNPRGKALYEDDSRFGTKMLEKMGWSKGKGLGAKENGSLDFVRVRYKDDAEGLGYDADARDDQWTAHEQNFSGLLKSLNGESEKAVECNESNEMCNRDGSGDELRPVGFGFKTDPVKSLKKSKKLTENISGESLEEKSKSSKARVHYKKFTRGKDLSRYSEKDLANIFGKKVADDQTDDVFQNLIVPETVTHMKSEEKELNPNYSGVQTISTGLSVSDYFKQKMEALKNKMNNGEKKVECQSLLQEIEVPVNENETENSCKKQLKRGLMDEVERDEVLEEPKKKKKKQKKECERVEIMEKTEEALIEQTEPKRKKKKKDVYKEQEKQFNNTEDPDSINNTHKIQKKNKSKRRLVEESIEIEEENSNQIKHRGLLNENSDAVNDSVIIEKKKKLKKAKKENNDERLENQEDNSNKKDDQLSENMISVNDNEKSQKKKQKKAKKEKFEESTTQSIIVDEISTKKMKKGKKNKELHTEEEASEVQDDNIVEAKGKKIKNKNKSEEDGLPLSSKDVSETLIISENSIDKSSNNESDASVVTSPQKELLSMDNLLKELESYDVFTISTFCAEEFRHIDMSAFKGSSFSQIIGYGFNEKLKLNIIETTNDQKRIMDLWMSKKSKYGKEKLAQKKRVYKFAKLKKKEDKIRDIKAFNRRNVFTVI